MCWINLNNCCEMIKTCGGLSFVDSLGIPHSVLTSSKNFETDIFSIKLHP